MSLEFYPENLTDDNIYFLDRETGYLYLFSHNNKGFYIQEDNNEVKFKWKINEKGLLQIKTKNQQFVWKLKEIDEENNYISIIEIQNKNGELIQKPKNINYDYSEQNVNKNFIFIFKLLNKKEKKFFIGYFSLIFIVLFTVFNFIFLLNQLHFFLKIIFIAIILLVSKDYLSFLFVKHLKQYIKEK